MVVVFGYVAFPNGGVRRHTLFPAQRKYRGLAYFFFFFIFIVVVVVVVIVDAAVVHRI